MGFKRSLNRAARNLSLRTGVLRKTLFRRYAMMYEPHQLEFLMARLRETRDVPGAVVEIGCAFGATTIFLKKFLDHLGSDKPYVALDTFGGFVADQAEHDIEQLGMETELAGAFGLNDKRWVAESLRLANVSGVELIQADATKFDFSRLSKISFCLLDVDLYQPISDILPKVYERLSPGGIIVVDDCQPHPRWEGALKVYREYMARIDAAPVIECGKLGIVRAPKAPKAVAAR